MRFGGPLVPLHVAVACLQHVNTHIQWVSLGSLFSAMSVRNAPRSVSMLCVCGTSLGEVPHFLREMLNTGPCSEVDGFSLLFILQKVRSHIGIVGNEKADAGAAKALASPTSCQYTLQDVIVNNQ